MKFWKNFAEFNEKFNKFDLKAWPFFAVIFAGFFAGAFYKYLDPFRLILLSVFIFLLVYHQTVMGVAIRRHLFGILRDWFYYIKYLIFKK